MPETTATTNVNENDAEKLARLLELELMQNVRPGNKLPRIIELSGSSAFFSFSFSSLHAQAVFSLSFCT